MTQAVTSAAQLFNMYPSAITYGIGMIDENYQIRDRLSRAEGRLESMEHRIEFTHTDVLQRIEGARSHADEAHKKADKNAEDMQEVKQFLDTARGAFNGAKWAFYLMSGLISLGLISVTFGG